MYYSDPHFYEFLIGSGCFDVAPVCADMRNVVRFVTSVGFICERGCNVFDEVGINIAVNDVE